MSSTTAWLKETEEQYKKKFVINCMILRNNNNNNNSSGDNDNNDKPVNWLCLETVGRALVSGHACLSALECILILHLSVISQDIEH